eukprot:1145652-Lingulodinium_polyedra.AAC.1
MHGGIGDYRHAASPRTQVVSGSIAWARSAWGAPRVSGQGSSASPRGVLSRSWESIRFGSS